MKKPDTGLGWWRRMQGRRVVLAFGLAILAPLAVAEVLLNVNFGPGDKEGFAAVGQATNDFWNTYHPTNESGLYPDGVLVPLADAAGSNTAAGILVYNVQGQHTNATGDAMFDTWLWAVDTNLLVVLTNVPYGLYDIYVYGHGDTNELNTLVDLTAGWTNFTQTYTTVSGTNWNSANWTLGDQFVLYENVAVPAGQMVTLTISTNAAGVALMNGLQLAAKTVPNQDTDGDGLTDAEELALGTNGSVSDTDEDGVSDHVEYLQGRNPLVAGAVADTSGLVNLVVYTPLQ